jgi:tRNA pseudouridine38-40 synthase
MESAERTKGAALVAYDGARFSGWQRHPGRATAQGALEDALSIAFGAPVRVDGAGRTDAGAHALGQVASFEVPAGHALEEALLRARASAAPGLEIRELRQVPAAFHARMDATGKTYRFALWRRELGGPDAPADAWSVGHVQRIREMRRALAHLVGEHDFTTFATPAGFERATHVRTIRRAELREDGPRLEFEFEADSFLYKMVRNLVRALVKVGEGRRDAESIRVALAARDRRAAQGTAPATGLTLVRVHYASPIFAAEGAEP